MCGIFGYIGDKSAAPILLEGLKRLEYRGYDSAGIATTSNGASTCVKAPGRISFLEEKLKLNRLKGRTGIAHTRWATHGKPSELNAHPHTDCKRKIYVAHNGIIENYQVLKQLLVNEGHQFQSETDTEVIAHMIEKHYRGNFEDAVKQTLVLLEGAFGLALIHTDHEDQILLARRSSPMIVGIGNNEMFGASDAAALIAHTKRVAYLEDDEIALLTSRDFCIDHLDKKFHSIVPSRTVQIDWDISAAEKQGFPHFMLKEIFEQPEAVRNAFRGRIIHEQGTSKLGGLDRVLGELRKLHRIIIISCGTSYHAGLIGRYMFEELTNYGVEVDLASEFRYRKLNLREGTVVLAISQSGETADSLAALREAKSKGALALGLVNVVGSSIARESDAGVYNHAGPEIGVASTKSFVSQVTIMMLFSLMLGRLQTLSLEEGRQILEGLERLPGQIEDILGKAEVIRQIAEEYAHYNNFLYLGRKYNYPVALEGALKLKEISYLHAEGYAAGEMKHGPIALIDRNFPTVCIIPQDSAYSKMLNNVQEIKARDGRVIAIATEGDDRLSSILEVKEGVDHVFYIPPTLEILTPILTTIPLQLLAYYIAAFNSCAIDMPRNLAKSVTVE